MAEPKLPPAHRETTDIEPRVVAILGGVALGMLLFALVAVRVIFPDTLKDQSLAGPVSSFADVQLQTSPRKDMVAFQAKETKLLNSYGWLDRAHGTVHVPIETAMAKLVAAGIPGWPAP